MYEVYYSDDFAECHGIRAHLESQGVSAMVQSGQVTALDGGANLFPTPFSGFGVYVVQEEDVERGRALIVEYLENRGADATPSAWVCPGCGEAVQAQFGECWHCGAPREDGARVAPEPKPDGGDFGAADDSSASDQRRDVRDVTEPSESTRDVLVETGVVLIVSYVPYLVWAVWGYLDPSSRARTFAVDMAYLILTNVQIAAVVLFVIWRSQESWAHFGLPRFLCLADPLGSLLIFSADWYIIGFVAVWLYTVFPGAVVEVDYPTPAGGFEWLVFVAAHLANGFAEELSMRGYLIPRLERITGSTWSSIVISSVLFGSYHIYQGPAPAFALFVMGILYGSIFAVIRRIWPLALAHALLNITIALPGSWG